MHHYLDHAATTPLRAVAREAWLRAQDVVGNASSTHGAGQAARRLLEESRERVAVVLDAEAIEVVFTSGGTESISLALQGLWGVRSPERRGVVLPNGEHHATFETVAALSAEVHAVPLDARGRISIDDFAAALPGAALATFLYANNEVGTINDAEALAAAAAQAFVPAHCDAVGAAGYLPLSFRRMRGDAAPGVGLVALSIAGHKVGAPVGTGALLVSRTANLTPMMRGGAQQRGLRAGTQDVAGAAALAAALESAESERLAETERLGALRDRLIEGVGRAVPEAELLGDPTARLPHNAHFLFPGAVGESLLFMLDMAGVSASTGSACQAGVAEPSHVVLAMGRSEQEARSVLRFSLGHTSTVADVDAVITAVPEAYRRASAGRAPGASTAAGSRRLV